MSNITLTKKIIEYENVFRSEVMVRQEVNYGIQRIISDTKENLKNPIENNLLEPSKKGQSFWLHGDVLKELLTINPMENIKKEQYFRKHDISY